MGRVRRIVTNPGSWIRGLRTPPGTAAELAPERCWVMNDEERQAMMLRLSASRRKTGGISNLPREADE